MRPKNTATNEKRLVKKLIISYCSVPLRGRHLIVGLLISWQRCFFGARNRISYSLNTNIYNNTTVAHNYWCFGSYCCWQNLLVCPKDKVNREETAECVYRIPYKNCQKVYIGETGRCFGVRMKEHRKEVEQRQGVNTPEAQRDGHSRSRTNRLSQTTST